MAKTRITNLSSEGREMTETKSNGVYLGRTGRNCEFQVFPATPNRPGWTNDTKWTHHRRKPD